MKTIRLLMVVLFSLLAILPMPCAEQNQQSLQPVIYSFRYNSDSMSDHLFSLNSMPPLEHLSDGWHPSDYYNAFKRFDNKEEALAKRDELRTSRFTDGNRTISNTELLKIAREQFMHGFFYDAMLTFEMVQPQEPSQELLEKIHNIGYLTRYYNDSGVIWKIRQTDIYQKDRLLRHFARVRFLYRDSLGAVQTARMIFSERERNNALLEIMRAQCYGAIREQGQFDQMMEKAYVAQSYLSDPAKDYGLGHIAYTYTYLHREGNDSKALETIDQIQSDSCRDEALEWIFEKNVWHREDNQIKEEFKKRVTNPLVLCRMRLKQIYHDHRSTYHSSNGGESFLATLDDLRDLAIKQPPSQEKYDFLYLIGREYAYHDPARAHKVLMTVFDDIKSLEATDPLLISNALVILQANQQYKISNRGGVPSIYLSLSRETILEIGNLVLEKTHEKYSQPVVTTNGHLLWDGKYAIGVNRYIFVINRYVNGFNNGMERSDELSRILAELLENNIPEVAEVVFALELDRNDLMACYRALTARYTRPRGFHEHEQRFKATLDRIPHQAQAHFLAAMYVPCFRGSNDFPMENYVKWLEECPDALRLIKRVYLDNRDYVQIEEYDPRYVEPHQYERHAKLKEMLTKIE